ncbi:response regulator [Bradyrhizobium sp. JYMT SZCCT0180]|uniref:response regulator n=1 Tax=Bradyrhizobium sp. JYMT SZCCT0180 TaxID=2807666 RepID=UPI001BABE89B|nr:response regulator [Bradyrhizobium sp. JYMT SZCCT0180]MBR1215565.1 response regulator [Bradyrhizobium sp. JYMT SZCCT0180]
MNEVIPVLVVDDDTSIQSIVEETLSDAGYSPTVASTGEEAALLLNANKYRAIIVDISFGRDRVRGWSVALRARAFDPALPVVYITGGNTDDWAVEGVPNSILLTKPFAPAQLVTAVSQLLNDGPTSGIH